MAIAAGVLVGGVFIGLAIGRWLRSGAGLPKVQGDGATKTSKSSLQGILVLAVS